MQSSIYVYQREGEGEMVRIVELERPRKGQLVQLVWILTVHSNSYPWLKPLKYVARQIEGKTIKQACRSTYLGTQLPPIWSEHQAIELQLQHPKWGNSGDNQAAANSESIEPYKGTSHSAMRHYSPKPMLVVRLVQRPGRAHAGLLRGRAAVTGRRRRRRRQHLLVQSPDRLRRLHGHRELVPYRPMMPRRGAPAARGARRARARAGEVEAVRLPVPLRRRRGRGGRLEVHGLARGRRCGDGPGGPRLGLRPRPQLAAGPPRGHRAAVATTSASSPGRFLPPSSTCRGEMEEEEGRGEERRRQARRGAPREEGAR